MQTLTGINKDINPYLDSNVAFTHFRSAHNTIHTVNFSHKQERSWRIFIPQIGQHEPTVPMWGVHTRATLSLRKSDLGPFEQVKYFVWKTRAGV